MRCATALIAVLFPAALIAAPPADKARSVDVVMCLDTSSSMDGLIHSAKRRLWTVVNDVARLEPMPSLRVALYSYGNNSYEARRGWVRREVELTTDLDEVYKRINALRTASSGSSEFAARVGRDALSELKWSEGKDALRILFICGNEAVDQDKEVSLATVAERAKAKGVVINTIYCGLASHADAAGWQAFARQCGGGFANIDQERARAEVAIKTPFDEEIEKLGAKMNETYVWYGAKGAEGRANQLAQDGAAKRTGDSVAVDRSVTKAGGLYRNSECDLIDRMKSEKDFDLKKIKEEELPDEIRRLKADERLPFLKKKAAEREEIQKKVAQLSAQRALFIDGVRAKQPKSAHEQALDDALRTILRHQAKEKGMKVKD
jgi:hypothetical protein